MGLQVFLARFYEANHILKQRKVHREIEPRPPVFFAARRLVNLPHGMKVRAIGSEELLTVRELVAARIKFTSGLENYRSE